MHKDPRSLVIGFLLCMSIFAVNNIFQVILSAAFLTLLFVAGGKRLTIPAGLICSSAVLFGILTLFNMIVVQTGTPLFELGFLRITDTGLFTALLFTYRLVWMLLACMLLVSHTSEMQLADAFESLLTPLKYLRVPVSELSFILALSLRFIPTLTKESQHILEAQQMRGARLSTGSLLARIRALIANLVPLLASMMRHSDALSLALVARGWKARNCRTHLYPLRMQTHDWIFIVVCALYACALIGLRWLA